MIVFLIKSLLGFYTLINSTRKNAFSHPIPCKEASGWFFKAPILLSSPEMLGTVITNREGKDQNGVRRDIRMHAAFWVLDMKPARSSCVFLTVLHHHSTAALYRHRAGTLQSGDVTLRVQESAFVNDSKREGACKMRLKQQALILASSIAKKRTARIILNLFEKFYTNSEAWLFFKTRNLPSVFQSSCGL